MIFYNGKSPIKGGGSVITVFRIWWSLVRGSLFIWSEDITKYPKDPIQRGHIFHYKGGGQSINQVDAHFLTILVLHTWPYLYVGLAGELTNVPLWNSWEGGPELFQLIQLLTFFHKLPESCLALSSFSLSHVLFSTFILAVAEFLRFLYSLQSSASLLSAAFFWAAFLSLISFFVSSLSHGAYLVWIWIVFMGP